MKSEILHVLSYFALFEYPPTLEEIHDSSRVKTELKHMNTAIQELVTQKLVNTDGNRYAKTKGILSAYQIKEQYSRSIISTFRSFYTIFSFLPTVRLIGISGSLSMLDSDENDDIDLFVVTAENTLWFTRLYVLVVTRLLSSIGYPMAKKLCWNIFMEESNLRLPRKKQNEYTAHELLQLKIIYDASQVAEKLLEENKWVLKILPNVQINYKKNNDNYSLTRQFKVFIIMNRILRYFQLKWLNKKGYKAIEYRSQVWFIQDDYEKKIPLKLKKV